MIPEGTYRARGVEAALGYTSNDTEQVAVELALLEEGFEALTMTWYGFFTEKTIEVTLKALRTLGWQGDDLSDLSGIDANEVYIVVAHEEDQEGNLRARVRWINASASGLQLKTRMDEGSAKAFAERMKGHVLAQKQRTLGTPGPTQRTSAAAGGTPARNGAAATGTPPRNGAAAAKRGKAGTRPAAPPDDDKIPF